MMPNDGGSAGTPLVHPAAAAWRRVGAGPAEIERVETLQVSKKASVYRLVRRDGPVIAKRYAGEGAMFERMIYEEILGPAGVSRLAFYGAVRDDAERGSWSFTEDAGGVALSLAEAEHRRAAASWLGELHGSAASLVAARGRADQTDIHLSRLRFTRDALAGPPRDALRSRGEELAHAVLALDSVRDVWDVVELALSAGPVTLVHGDFGPRNVRMRRDRAGSPVVAYDWEMAVVGSPAVDLWWLGDGSDPLAVDAYRRTSTAIWRDASPNQLLRFARVGSVLRLVDCIYWSLWTLEWQMSSVLRWSRDLEGAISLLRAGERLAWSGGRA